MTVCRGIEGPGKYRFSHDNECRRLFSTRQVAPDIEEISFDKQQKGRYTCSRIMNKKHSFYTALVCGFVCVALLLVSCAGSPPMEEAAEPSPAPEAPSPETEQPEDGPEKAPEPAPQPEGEAETGDDGYVMDEQEYEETKKDLAQLVSELNEIIASRNYSEWLTYLTDEYKDYYSAPEVLEEFSEAPVLKKYDIKLRSLRDYFNYVVVASRKNVKVDDIQAISPEKVKAYMYVDGDPVVVYTLEKVDGRWKITK